MGNGYRHHRQAYCFGALYQKLKAKRIFQLFTSIPFKRGVIDYALLARRNTLGDLGSIDGAIPAPLSWIRIPGKPTRAAVTPFVEILARSR